MLCSTTSKLLVALSLLIGANGMLPLKKRPLVPDVNVKAQNKRYSPTSISPEGESSNGLMISNTIGAPSLLAGQVMASPTLTGGQLKQAAVLRSNNEDKRMKSFAEYRSVAETLRGRYYDTLNENEKKQVSKARHYFHQRNYQDKKKGITENMMMVQEANKYINMLPTVSVLHQEMTRPLTKEQQKRIDRALYDRERNDRKQAAKFMQREFGIKQSQLPLKRGPKNKDISTMEPDLAKKVVARREYLAQRKIRKQNQGQSSTE
jgi:hypothetical protein